VIEITSTQNENEIVKRVQEELVSDVYVEKLASFFKSVSEENRCELYMHYPWVRCV